MTIEMKNTPHNVSADNIRLNNSQMEHVAGITTEYPYCMHITDLSVGEFPWHWHEELEFGYVTNGQMELILTDRSYILCKGQGYFTNSNLLCRAREVDTSEKTVVETHMFHPVFLSGHFKSIFETKYIDPVIHNKALDVLIFKGNTANQQKILSKLREASLLQKQENAEMQTRNLFSEIWILLLAEIKEQPSHSVNLHTQERLQTFLAFIHRNYESKLTLKDIADSASVSTRECLRCFQHSIGQTPVEYLLAYRIHMAQKFLAETDLSVTEIGLQCGFSSNAYFGKIFREKCHETPLQYRYRIHALQTDK